MKLNTKLKISFVCMFALPIVICVIGAALIISLQDAAFRSAYGTSGIKLVDSITSLPLLSRMTDSVYGELQEAVNANPDCLDAKEDIQAWAERVSERYSSLVVRKDGVIVYSNSTIEQSCLYEILPEFGDGKDSRTEYGRYYGGDYRCLVKQVDFTNALGSKISAYIITSAQMIPQTKVMLIEFAAIVIVTLMLISLFLTVWMNRAIVHPILKLNEETRNIKEGNLDTPLPVNDGRDEISNLTRDFEEMRVILKDSAEEKVRTEAEEKELIRNISHDLKTPLTAIKGYVEGLMDGVADTPEKRQKYLRTIYNKANDMDRLIDELTMYSKIDMNKVPYTFRRININSYMTDCCEEIGVDLESRGIGLEFHNYSDGGQYVMIDCEQMKRVINNIVNNSVKYMADRKGVMKIEIFDDGENVLIRLEDNGKGIAAEDLKHIFERFYRADSARGTKEGGSGIGLAIVKKIVEDHGGTIWAESTEGIGTVMNIRLKKAD